MSDVEKIPIGFKSIFGLRAMALLLSGEKFFNGGVRVGCG